MKCKICNEKLDWFFCILGFGICYYCKEAKKEIDIEEEILYFTADEKKERKLINSKKKYFR